MIAAFDEVLAAFPEARLHLVGHFMPPDLEQEVRADIRARGIEHAVTVFGRVPFESITPAPALVITTSSPAGGTVPPLQFAPVHQSFVPDAVHVFVAAPAPVATAARRNATADMRAIVMSL